MESTLEALPGACSHSQLLLCPTCGQALPLDAKFCPFDGRELTSSAARSSELRAAVDSGQISGMRGAADSAQVSGTREVVRAQDSLVGWVVDERYEVLQLLGEGGMGCVYRVRHRVLGRQFALKALRPELSRDPVLAQRFVQEARAAAAISHPNVVGITDFGMLDRGQPYFVMELLEGRTLSSVLRESPILEPERVVSIASAVASALAAAHVVGVIHRDLKPDNIILLGDGTNPSALKVLDFGLAQLSGSSRMTRDDIVYGTPQYMSPEQAAGEPLDPRVDVYALGILMYEMLTGSVPFEADSYMGVLTKQLYVEPTPLSSISPVLGRYAGLERLVLRCLSKDREARFPGMVELAQALEQLGLLPADSTQIDSVRGRTPSRSNPTFRRSRSGARTLRRTRWWVCAWVGVAALGLALVLLFGRLSGGVSHTHPSVKPASIEAAPDHQTVRETRAAPLSAEPQQAGKTAPTLGAQPEPATKTAKHRPRKTPERLLGQPQQEVRTAEPREAGTRSFGNKNTSGSSEIANPWAE